MNEALKEKARNYLCERIVEVNSQAQARSVLEVMDELDLRTHNGDKASALLIELPIEDGVNFFDRNVCGLVLGYWQENAVAVSKGIEEIKRVANLRGEERKVIQRKSFLTTMRRWGIL